MEFKSCLVPLLLPTMALLLLAFGSSPAAAQLQVGYYSKTCPNVEAIVRNETAKIIGAAPSLAGPLLRLHFHDCFVRGCDASVLLESNGGNKAEKDAKPNKSLRGFGSVERVKAKLEAACPNTVSCADVLTLMARDAVVLARALPGLSHSVGETAGCRAPRRRPTTCLLPSGTSRCSPRSSPPMASTSRTSLSSPAATPSARRTAGPTPAGYTTSAAATARTHPSTASTPTGSGRAARAPTTRPRFPRWTPAATRPSTPATTARSRNGGALPVRRRAPRRRHH
ncbi:hypothetical protein BDA96_10G161000 [Sorghum bicolor]|uniref:Peroxidase n=1 Tax=Sorghum bicolor TaxID=4558 RepID=A0A921Q5E9_SORBI|nr:hypothetical protein BDA96_10G161000 [Sorghum bicolor]